ncbi:hypothetical protein TEQG_08861 [Trichophyton equinum CBS 127.97]|uniref:Uncharacterized protein n=1 Tax=Trichophyton equinum (strain ATCC MYA-4606 / CBS 127.97) TaxID=559882 RepID=F2Q626_TRIEC|nr:hypothetical protein TEQG_08861 [Trichophyton equinum CBS 127.97]
MALPKPKTLNFVTGNRSKLAEAQEILGESQAHELVVLFWLRIVSERFKAIQKLKAWLRGDEHRSEIQDN